MASVVLDPPYGSAVALAVADVTLQTLQRQLDDAQQALVSAAQRHEALTQALHQAIEQRDGTTVALNRQVRITVQLSERIDELQARKGPANG